MLGSKTLKVINGCGVWTMAGLLDPDEADAYLRDWQDRIERMAAGTRAMSDRLGELRATGRDDNGLAEVTVDATGALVDVRLTDRVQRVAPDVTARAVLAAGRAARRRAAEQSRRIVSETTGNEALAERVEQQLLGPFTEESHG